MSDQLDRIEELGKDILHQIQTDVTNQTLIEKLRELEALLKSGSVPIPGGDPTIQPAFSSGEKGTRRVQMKETTRLRIPKTGPTGKILYTRKGGLKFYKPTSTKKYYIGDVVEVWRPFVQGDGTKLWEVVGRPGQFLITRQINFL